MKPAKSALAIVAAAGAVALGGLAVGIMDPLHIAGAQTPGTTEAPVTTQAPVTTAPATPDPSTPTPSTPAAGGKFTPNEDPAHEATESPQREADEDSGKIGPGGHGGPGGRHGGKFTPNEDPAHEATESPEREAQEDSGQAGNQAPSNNTPAAPTAPSTTPNTAGA